MNQKVSFLPWLKKQPERFEWELAQLHARGWAFSVDQDALESERVVLRGEVASDTGPRQLMIVFPNTYPEHRMEIYDLTGDEVLPLHQNPYQRNLCLLDNVPAAWVPNHDHAAMMVDRVLELRRAAKDGVEGLERIGVGAPEPRSTYYPCEDNSSVLIPENVLGIPGDSGWFQFKTLNATNLFRGVISQVAWKSPAPYQIQAPKEITDLFGGLTLRGAWMRLPDPPPYVNTALELHNWACSSVNGFKKVLTEESVSSRDLTGHVVRPFAFVYQDKGPEGPHDAWLVGLLIQETNKHKPVDTRGVLIRPFILSSADQQRRIGSIARLSGKKVAIIGLGTVGASVALELARTGLLSEMLLVDYDYYSVGNLVRHPLDLRALGINKAKAIAGTIQSCAPFLKLTVVNKRIGDARLQRTPDQGTEAELLSQLQDVDLIVDATADIGTTRFLNRFSLKTGIPMIVTSVTEGGWGGEVVRSIPGKTGCFECYEWNLKDGVIIEPSQDIGAAPVFTRGCGFPTFAGTGFDALSMAADTTRLAVQTMLRDEQNAYPDVLFDILIRHNRGAGSSGTFPRYDAFKLEVHPKCAWHSGDPL